MERLRIGWRAAVATRATALPGSAADALRFSHCFSFLFFCVISAAEAAKPAEVQTAFSVRLDSFDAKDKIKVIKEVRTATGLGLKESKDLVEGAPKVIKKDLSKADADALVAKLKEAGAKCTLE